MALSASVVIARGKNQVGTIDYNPVVRSLGTNRRPEDVNGVGAHPHPSFNARRSGKPGTRACCCR